MSRALKILAIEPYAALSHQLFLEGLREHSRHDWQLSTLPARKWKWRMRTAALHFVEQVENGPSASEDWDLLFVSDFLNLQELRALLSERACRIPVVIYFHENQLTYPLQAGEELDYHYGLTHFYSILSADSALFNSGYHKDSFLEALERVLKLVPDIDTRSQLEQARSRCQVMPLGTDVAPRAARRGQIEVPTILWSHRWEYDKDPRTFVNALYELAARGVPFRVRVLGERFRVAPPEFAELQERLPDHLEQVGFVPDRDAYLEAVAGADVFVSTARHEFFGLATLEAIRCGLVPLLPRDLAYPELVATETGAGDASFLYDRSENLADRLQETLTVVREGGWSQQRNELIAASQRYHWDQLGPAYDALFAELCDAT
ncbi:MAG: DUF3524 domain-containing protein [Planctomycetota bacterium]